MERLIRFAYPKGKVHPKYLQYVGWSFLSNVSVSAQSVLSVHSMLSSVTQAESASIMSSNFIGKDILGQIGSIAYMSKMASSADKEPKKFIKYSNFFQQASLTLQSITPLVPLSHFLLYSSIGNIGMNISFTCFGAVNAKIIQKLSMDNNVGEIYARLTVINTVGSSIGMLIGLGITATVPDHYARLCFLPLLGAVRIYSFNKAIDGFLT